MTLFKSQRYDTPQLSPRDIVYRSYLLYGNNYGLKRSIAKQIRTALIGALEENQYETMFLDTDERPVDYVIAQLSQQSLLYTSRVLLVTGSNVVNKLGKPILNALKRVSTFTKVIIIVDENLNSKSALLSFYAQSEQDVAIACYDDQLSSIAPYVREATKHLTHQLTRNSIEEICEQLLGDRWIAIHEIEKLYLLDSEAALSRQEIMDLLTPFPILYTQDLADLVFSGNTLEIPKTLEHILSTGLPLITLLSQIVRYTTLLLSLQAFKDSDQKLYADKLFPKHFKRKAIVKKHLELWSTTMLLTFLHALYVEQHYSRFTNKSLSAIRLVSLLQSTARQV